jgi:hypothetical protein
MLGNTVLVCLGLRVSQEPKFSRIWDFHAKPGTALSKAGSVYLYRTVTTLGQGAVCSFSLECKHGMRQCTHPAQNWWHVEA